MTNTNIALANFRQHSLDMRLSILATMAYGADMDDIPFDSPQGKCLEDLMKLVLSIGAPLTDDPCLCGPRATDVRELNCGQCGGYHKTEIDTCEACGLAYPVDNMVYSEEDSLYLCINCIP